MKNELVKNHIIDWLNQYCISSKKDGFVIGISGGIDSALTSTLCALTSKKTICLSMPINQNTNQIERANEHIRFLKKQFKNVVSIDLNLSDSFNHFKTELSKYCNSEISFVNSKSRLRMVSLYCIAQEKNVLVTGTGNKVEDFGIGFYTKYGDGGVDLSPIADLMKSQVKELAEFLNISKNIIEAPPTDGLWDNDKTDEQQIGATYDELEWAMTFDSSENKLTSRQREVLRIYRKFNQSNTHKMLPIPVCKIPNELI